MTFSPEILSILVLLSLGFAGFCLVGLVVLSPRGRLRDGAAGGPNRETLKALREHAQAINQLRDAVQRLAGEDRRLGEAMRGTVQRVGLVRYDAFDDMSGNLSFSGALLDASGDGMVITSINGRSDTRCYAKPVSNGESSFNLSEEEAEAIRQALAEPVAARV